MVASDSGKNSDREENQTGNCLYLQLRASTDSGQGKIFVSRFRDGVTERHLFLRSKTRFGIVKASGLDRDGKTQSRNFRAGSG